MITRQAEVMSRTPVAAVLLLVAVLGAVVAAAPPAPLSPLAVANRGWDAPSGDVFAELD